MMRARDPLEARLCVLDLQLVPSGDHLEDEQIARIASGGEPSAAEARHLAGCDECVELLVALGEGLEGLAEERPGLSAVVAAPAPHRARGRRRFSATLTMLAVLAGGVAAAAIGWMAQRPDEPVTVVEPAAPDAPPPPAPPTAKPALAPPAVEAVAPPAPEAPTEETAPTEEAAPTEEEAAPAVEAVNLPAAQAAPEPLRPERPATRGAAAERAAPVGPDARLSRPDGPRPVNRLPVSGPPRGWGYLRLATKPTARVFIDGEERGWTPLVDLRLPAGPHDIRLVYEHEAVKEPEQQFRVVIVEDETWKHVRDNLRPDR